MTRARTAAIVVLCTLGLGACGGGGSNDGNAAPAKAKAQPSGVVIQNFAFSPDALRVKTGTKVTFTNHDGFDHTVTAKDGSFDSGHLVKDAVFTRTFDTPGTYPYLCGIHNSMTGSVVVS
jgi:plastocyanin